MTSSFESLTSAFHHQMDFIIGVSSSLVCNAISTIGLNIQTLAMKQPGQIELPESPPSIRNSLRIWANKYQWHLGFLMYIAFQALGSIVALSFISPVILAPLGSAGLIFNILFSHMFLGTKITRSDWIGTSLIVAGCVLVSIFGASAPDDREASLISIILF